MTVASYYFHWLVRKLVGPQSYKNYRIAKKKKTNAYCQKFLLDQKRLYAK